MEILSTPSSVQGPAEWFTGIVHFDVIAPGDRSRGKVNAVHFTPGARTAWHCHINGQTLHVTEGIGLTQSRGGEVTVIRAGQTVWCPPGEWHWHGATPEHHMTHLAIWDGLAEGQDGPAEQWGALVTDAEYDPQH
jgi:quercetin dioxygenase-like cupin family protein